MIHVIMSFVKCVYINYTNSIIKLVCRLTYKTQPNVIRCLFFMTCEIKY